ncbi:MAG: aminopeptidase N [Propionibacteriaceae bacterium]|jgi:aminopeptidase N|nr:aminopeptidase N [Propionibacteriaceae bacterium]
MPGYNLTRAEAEARAELITVQGYDITLDLTAQGETFPSTTTIRFTCATPGASTFLDLIAPSVTRISLNGLELDPGEVFSDSRIQLSNLKADNTVTIEAQAAYSHTGEGLHRFTDPVDDQTYIYTQCEVADARRFFACFEQPDLKSQFVFHVIAPAQWTVISNRPTPEPVPGDGVGVQAGTAGVWNFEPTVTMSTYLTAVIAGPYRRWDDLYESTDGRQIPLGAFVRESMASYFDAEEIFDVTKRGFGFYEQAFGVPYPYDKYDQAFVPQYNAGAMENIGAITLTEDRYVFRSKPVAALVDARANTILHEQAHMWFGDLVTMKWWNDLWLNESFAEFMSHLAAVNTRWPNAWADFLAQRKLVGYEQDQLPTTHPIVANIRDLADVEVNFDMITYAKGASVLKQLVAWVGQDNFLTGVHSYLTKHAWGNATLHDFLTEVEQASGRDLTEWSTLWLEEAGVTILRPEIVGRREGVYERVTILQEIPEVYSRFGQIPHRDLPPVEVHPSLRPHHLAVAGYVFGDGEMTRAWSHEVDVAGASTDLPELVGQVIPDLLIINDGDLTYAKLRLDKAGLEVLPRVLEQIDDPLTRALVWGSLWDSLRDGELSARTYVDLVLGAIEREDSSTTVLSLLARLRQTLKLYVAAEFRAETQDDAAAQLVGLAMRADPGSDQQLQFFKAFAALACNDTQWRFIAGVLDGVEEVPGLLVDTDLRWELLTDLVAVSVRGASDIDAELAKDDTISGLERAAGARAALPSAEAKRAAWRAGVFDESVTNAAQRHILAGFTKVADPVQLRDYAIEFFAQIEQVWVTRSREMAQNVVKLAYPVASVNDPEIDVVEMADLWLDRLGAKLPALRRLILVGREETLRARAAQAVDAAA